MKLVCSKSNLLTGLQVVSKAVPNKTTMSILECILIDSTGGEIKLTANDMELGIETIIEGDIVEKGIIALDAKIFLEIVRKLPDNDITITTDSDFKTTITCEKAKFNIIGKSGEDFSYLPMIERNESIVLSQYTLKEVIRQTIFSISDNDNNKLMSGELFEINGEEMRVISLDGHRISIRKIHLKNFYPSQKVVVPGKTLNEISKILGGDADKDVTIFFTDKHIVFEFENTTVVSRLIEGEYFKIDQMLSSDYETKVEINKKELLDCIDRATLLIKEMCIRDSLCPDFRGLGIKSQETGRAFFYHFILQLITGHKKFTACCGNGIIHCLGSKFYELHNFLRSAAGRGNHHRNRCFTVP